MTNQSQPVYLEPAQTASASVIWLHGLGADGHDFVDVVPMLGLPADHTVRFVFPHAPHRPVTCNGGIVMPAWYDIVEFGSLEQQDKPGMQASCQSLHGWISEQVAAGVPSERIVLIGFSQGGAVALYGGLNAETPLAGIAGLSTYLPFAEEFSGPANGANAQTPILMQHGIEDDVVPMRAGQASIDCLQAQQRTVGWQTYPMAHQVCPQQMHDLGDWLQQRLAKLFEFGG